MFCSVRVFFWVPEMYEAAVMIQNNLKGTQNSSMKRICSIQSSRKLNALPPRYNKRFNALL